MISHPRSAVARRSALGQAWPQRRGWPQRHIGPPLKLQGIITVLNAPFIRVPAASQGAGTGAGGCAGAGTSKCDDSSCTTAPDAHGWAVDYDALRNNVKRALRAGVVGFLVPALATEVSKLTDAERHAMVRAVLDEVHAWGLSEAGGARRDVAVIAGASADTNEDRVRLAKEMLALGAHGVLANIPYVTK